MLISAFCVMDKERMQEDKGWWRGKKGLWELGILFAFCYDMFLVMLVCTFFVLYFFGGGAFYFLNPPPPVCSDTDDYCVQLIYYSPYVNICLLLECIVSRPTH